MVEGEAEEGVARFEQRHVDGVVGLGAGVGLDVGVLGAEELLGPLDRQLLGDVDLLAAAVVAAAGVALGVLVGQHRADRFEHRLRARSSPRRSSPASAAGAAARPRAPPAISGSTSVSGAVWKFSGSSAIGRATIATGRDSLWPVREPASSRLARPGAPAGSRRCPQGRARPGREPLRRARGEGSCSARTCGSRRRSEIYVRHVRRPRAAARDQRRAAAAASGPMELRGRRNGWRSMQRQPADLQGGRRPHHRPHRGDAALHLRRHLLRRLLLEGPPARPASSSAGSAPTERLGAGRPHQPEAQLLPARPRADPRRAPLARRAGIYPGCNQDPYIDRVTLGTSVGWSDIYPAAYHQQWIDVGGLRGCFAYRDDRRPQGTALRVERERQQLPPPRPPALPRRHRLLSPRLSRDRPRRACWRGRPGERAVAEDAPAAVLLDRGDVDDGRGQAGQLAAVDRQVGAVEDRLGQSSKRAGAGSPLRLAEVWKTGHIVPASGPPIRRMPSRSGSWRQASG